MADAVNQGHTVERSSSSTDTTMMQRLHAGAASATTASATAAGEIGPFLAADVGGTHARIGLVIRDAGESSAVSVLHYHRYSCTAWPSLTLMLRDFVQRLADTPHAAAADQLAVCSVACAGYVLDDAIVNENLPWPVSISDIRNGLGIDTLTVVNDFEAVAYASQFIKAQHSRTIIASEKEPAEGPVLVMGPGTGLGSAVLLPAQPRARILAAEAGQIALAPGNPREIEILRVLARERAHVSVEDALSGPGLLKLYKALCELRGCPARCATPADVTAAALADNDPAALEALQVFCGLLGSFVGDLVLLYGTSGGVWLAGGILPQIQSFLLTSTFTERYFNKGVMRAYLEKVPVRLMDHGQLGVIGAAGMYLDRRHAH